MIWTCADFAPMCYWRLIIQTTSLPESHWTGARVVLGEAVLDVMMPTIRCVVPSRAQPGFEVDRRITKAVAVRAQRCLGVYCGVDSRRHGPGLAMTFGCGLPTSSGHDARPERMLTDCGALAGREGA